MAPTLEYSKRERAINSKDLLDTYEYYLVQIDLATKAKDRALSDKTNKYILDLGLSIVGAKKKNRDDAIKEYFDNMQKILEDNVIVNMVAVFERLTFESLNLATDNARKVLKENYREDKPFSSSVAALVKTKDDINNLSGIHSLATGSMTTSLAKDLKEIIEYRNRVAHGKRFGNETTKTVKDVLEVLDEALTIIS